MFTSATPETIFAAYLVSLEKGRAKYKSGHFAEAKINLGIAKDQSMSLLAPAFAEWLWATRYEILKDESLDAIMKKTRYYEEVVPDAELFLQITIRNIAGYVKERISVIKLLLLIPDQDIENLCAQGLGELEEAMDEGIIRDNLKAEILNSLGIFYKRPDTPLAIKKFEEALELATPGTVICGHLLQNLGDCYQNYFRDSEKSASKRAEAFHQALDCWHLALENYPEDQKVHRESVQKRINGINEEMKKKTA